jgi:hypothetical protein
MRANNWLKRLGASERGNVRVLGAVTLPLLMGSAGLAVDSIKATCYPEAYAARFPSETQYVRERHNPAVDH